MIANPLHRFAAAKLTLSTLVDKVKVEEVPFRIVLDNILEISKVRYIPNNITKSTQIVERIDAPIPVAMLPIKILAIVIKNGNLPLQGTKLFCITTKSHAHSKCLLASCASLFKVVI